MRPRGQSCGQIFGFRLGRVQSYTPSASPRFTRNLATRSSHRCKFCLSGAPSRTILWANLRIPPRFTRNLAARSSHRCKFCLSGAPSRTIGCQSGGTAPAPEVFVLSFVHFVLNMISAAAPEHNAMNLYTVSFSLRKIILNIKVGMKLICIIGRTMLASPSRTE